MHSDLNIFNFDFIFLAFLIILRNPQYNLKILIICITVKEECPEQTQEKSMKT